MICIGGADMKVSDIMTKNVIGISSEESAEVAARTLTHYNIGALPVQGSDGKLCGLVTDRDLVIRCMALGKLPNQTKVKNIMTGQVLSVGPDTDAAAAAQLMGSRQIRRLPVVDQGKLCGMISLADIARKEENQNLAADALSSIASNVQKM